MNPDEQRGAFESSIRSSKLYAEGDLERSASGMYRYDHINNMYIGYLEGIRTGSEAERARCKKICADYTNKPHRCIEEMPDVNGCALAIGALIIQSETEEGGE